MIPHREVLGGCGACMLVNGYSSYMCACNLNVSILEIGVLFIRL